VSKSLETYLDWERVSQTIKEKAGVAINVGKAGAMKSGNYDGY